MTNNDGIWEEYEDDVADGFELAGSIMWRLFLGAYLLNKPINVDWTDPRMMVVIEAIKASTAKRRAEAMESNE